MASKFALATLLSASIASVTTGRRFRRAQEISAGQDTRPWRACANEGGPITEEGQVRFGWGLSWVEAKVPSGSLCSTRTFGSDPAPRIKKQCMCAGIFSKTVTGEEVREDVGTSWTRCAKEGGACACAKGSLVRFGAGARWVTTKNAIGNVSCSLASFGGADPAVATRKECWCEQQPKTVPKRARTAIVMLSRNPPDLKTWLQYHLDYMGIERVFIDVEDTPQWNSTWATLSPAHQQRVSVFRAPPTRIDTRHGIETRPSDDYETLQARQIKAMTEAKASSATLGIDWLIHIDDDELLYTPVHRPIGEVLASLPGDVDQAYIPNVEAMYPSPGVKSCFTETSEANANRYLFASYANGKAAVRVADAMARPAGPHQWRDGDLEPNSVHMDEEPFGSPVMVVHYEACPFHRWEDKYWELGNTSPEKIKSIPFAWYRESIRAMQHCRNPAEMKRRGCQQDNLMHFWSSWKTRENPRIRAPDRIPIQIPWAEITAGAKM